MIAIFVIFLHSTNTRSILSPLQLKKKIKVLEIPNSTQLLEKNA